MLIATKLHQSSPNATDRRQVARMTPTQAANYSIALINVQSLLTRHNEVVGAGMAQYL